MGRRNAQAKGGAVGFLAGGWRVPWTWTSDAHRSRLLTMGTRTVLHTAGVFGLVASAVVGMLAIGPSCIVHDTGIIVLKDGFKWCANAEGAIGWDTNPGESEPLFDDDGQVLQGCGCFDDDEHALLEGWEANGVPAPADPDYDHYVILRDEILLDARDVCVKRANEEGFTNNNCVPVIPDTDEIFSNGMSGECKYQEIAIADTDGGTETSSVPPPFDLSGLVCSGGDCSAPQSLIDDMHARPEAFLNDDTRIVFDAGGYLVFKNVSRGDVAYTVGLRSGDKLLKINGQDASSLDQVASVLADLHAPEKVTARIKDAYGDEVTFKLTVTNGRF